MKTVGNILGICFVGLLWMGSCGIKDDQRKQKELDNRPPAEKVEPYIQLVKSQDFRDRYIFTTNDDIPVKVNVIHPKDDMYDSEYCMDRQQALKFLNECANPVKPVIDQDIYKF